MEQAIQVYAIINFAIIGLSHVVRPPARAEFCAFRHERGEAGVFATAFLSLILARSSSASTTSGRACPSC